MNKKDLRIVFMGTPEFAVESLKILVENEYNVVGVITMPDKPSGRGYKIQYSDVKKYALEKNLPLLQPERLKDESFLTQLKDWNADLQIVVAFRMLPEVVWNMPRFGTFNLHGSLLPQYRGAAPINWAIMNGEKETGVTTFFLTHEIDTGRIILQDRVAIGENDNAGKIHDELMMKGAQLVCKTVDVIIEDTIESIPQEQFYKDDGELKAAPKIFKETCRIDWSQPAEDIHNHIRGLSPYPAAWTELCMEDKGPVMVKIYETRIEDTDNAQKVGCCIETDDKTYLHVYCGDGKVLAVAELQLAGKKRLTTEEFLRGYKFEEGASLK